MQSAIIKYGYVGIFLLIAIENIFPPIPSEVILTFSGFISTSTNLDLLLIIIVSTFGSLFGAIILYFIGFYLNRERLIKITNSKIGSLLRLKTDSIIESINVFNKEGYKSVFVCRFIPILRSLISIPAGIARINFLVFIVLTFLGSLLWNTIFVLLGNMIGENWNLVIDIFKTFYKPIMLVIVVIFILYKYKKKKSK